MRYGVCSGMDKYGRVALIKEAGFDYIEAGFSGISREDDEVFERFKAELIKNDIRCEAANGFLPRDYKVLGDVYDEEKIKAYIEKGMARGEQIGLKTVVFGSGGAREIPEGMSYTEAFSGLAKFLKNVVSPIAAKHGITVVIEPLRKDECNIINTVKEGVLLALMSGCDNIFGLGDIYHMIGAGDTYEDVVQLAGSLKHAHISNPVGKNGGKRCYPLDADEFDYKGFVASLEKAGCTRCSIEAGTDDFDTEIFIAGRVLKNL